jgi:adenylosuccinate synthase
MKNTNYFFKKGKVSFVLDGASGSSGKSLISSFLVENSNKVDFLLSSFTPNASHTVSNDDGSEFVFKIFAGGSQFHEKLKAIYIVDNSAIELDTLKKEMEYLGIPREKVRISPRCAIVQQIDKDFEAGLCDLDGRYFSSDEIGDGTIKTGSTCSGSGSVLAKKTVRNKTLVTAKDVPELADMLYKMDEIINRLECGQSGLYEIAQGFPLSMNHHRFAPHTTSRNVSVTNAMNDAFLPTMYAGNVMINWRTLPIKIHSKKYKSKETGKFLTWDEVEKTDKSKYDVVESYSGFLSRSKGDFLGRCNKNVWKRDQNNGGHNFNQIAKKDSYFFKDKLGRSHKIQQHWSQHLLDRQFCKLHSFWYVWL